HEKSAADAEHPGDEPNCAPKVLSFSLESPASKKRLRPRKAAAPSLLPPPSPAPCGISLRSVSRTLGARFVSEKNKRAARTTKLSLPARPISSQRNSNPFEDSSSSESQSVIGAIKVSIS